MHKAHPTASATAPNVSVTNAALATNLSNTQRHMTPTPAVMTPVVKATGLRVFTPECIEIRISSTL